MPTEHTILLQFIILYDDSIASTTITISFVTTTIWLINIISTDSNRSTYTESIATTTSSLCIHLNCLFYYTSTPFLLRHQSSTSLSVTQRPTHTIRFWHFHILFELHTSPLIHFFPHMTQRQTHHSSPSSPHQGALGPSPHHINNHFKTLMHNISLGIELESDTTHLTTSTTTTQHKQHYQHPHKVFKWQGDTTLTPRPRPLTL